MSKKKSNSNTQGSSSSSSSSAALNYTRILLELGPMAHKAILKSALMSGHVPEDYGDPEVKQYLGTWKPFTDKEVWDILRTVEISEDKNLFVKVVEFFYQHLKVKLLQPDDNNGDTLLHFAAKNDIPKLAEFLKKEGEFNLEAQNDLGLIPIKYCKNQTSPSPAAAKLIAKNPGLKLTETGRFLLKEMSLEPTAANVSAIGFIDDVLRDREIKTTKDRQDYLFKKSKLIATKLDRFLSDLMRGSKVDQEEIASYINSNIDKDFCEGLNLQKYGIADSSATRDLMHEELTQPLQGYVRESVPTIVQLSSVLDLNLCTSIIQKLLSQGGVTKDYTIRAINITLSAQLNKGLDDQKIEFFEKVRKMVEGVSGTVDIGLILKHYTNCTKYYDISYSFTKSGQYSIEGMKFLLTNEKTLKAKDQKNSTTEFIASIIIHSRLLNDTKDLEQLVALLSVHSKKHLVEVLTCYIKLVKNEISLDDIFAQYAGQNIKGIFEGMSLNKLSDLPTFSEGSELAFERYLWLDLLLNFAISNDRVKEAMELLSALKDRGILQPIFDSTLIVQAMDIDSFLRVIKEVEAARNDQIFKEIDVFWNFGKFFASIYHNRVGEYTFEALKFIEKLIFSVANIAPRIKEAFASGCKLVVEHLLDQEGSDLEQITKYLGFAEQYGAKNLEQDKFRLALKSKKLKSIQEELAKLKALSSQKEAEELGRLTVALEKDNASDATIIEVEKAFVTADEKVEKAEERSLEAEALLYNFTNYSKKSKKVDEPKDKKIFSFKFKIKGQDYQYSEKNKATDKEHQVYRISSVEEKYAAISEDALAILRGKQILSKCLDVIEYNGLDRGWNKIIATKNYYKIKIDRDHRLYTQVEYKTKINNKDVVILIFDRLGGHKEITGLTSKLEKQEFPGSWSLEVTDIFESAENESAEPGSSSKLIGAID